MPLTLYPSETHSKRFKRLILRNTLIGIVLALVIGVSVVAIAPGYAYDVLRVEDDNLVLGSPGVLVTQTSSTSSEVVDVLRTSSFTLESGWWFDDYSSWPANRLTYTNSSDGIQVSGRDSDFRMSRYLNLLVDDFESVNFSFSFRSVSGPMICGVRLVVEEGWTGVGEFTDAVEWEGGSEGTFSYEAPMDILQARTLHWALFVRFEIQVKFPDIGSAFIYDARVQAIAIEPVIPVLIDMRDFDDERVLGKTESRCILQPYINMTSSHHSQYSFIMIINSNESVFLPIGNYSLDYGWFGWNVHQEFHRKGTFLLNITSNSEIFVIIRMSMARLYIESNIGAYLRIKFSDATDWFSNQYGTWVFLTTLSSYVYFPAEYGPLYVEIWMGDFRYGTNFTIGMNHLRLHVTFPVFNFMGIGLDAVQLLVVLILASLFLAVTISLTNAASPIPLSNALRKDRGLSILLFILSYFLPWAVYIRPVFTYAGMILSVNTMCVPTGLTTHAYIPGITFIQFQSSFYGLLFQLFFQFLLFWLPVLEMMNQSLYDIPLRKNLRTLLPPAVPGIFALLAIIYPGEGASVGLGAVLAFAALMIMVLRVTHKWWLDKEKSSEKADEPE